MIPMLSYITNLKIELLTNTIITIYINDIIFVGFIVTEDSLKNIASLSGALGFGDDFLEASFRILCESIIKDPTHIKSKDYVKAYLDVKYRIHP